MALVFQSGTSLQILGLPQTQLAAGGEAYERPYHLSKAGRHSFTLPV